MDEIEELYKKSIEVNVVTMVNDYLTCSSHYYKMKKMGFNMDGAKSLLNYYRQNIIEYGLDIDEIDKLIE